MFDAPTQRILPSTRLCRVHLFRHAEVVGLRGRTCRGHADVPLSPAGEQRSAAAAAWFHAHHPPPDHVYTSDLSRCLHLARALHPAPEVYPALREQDMGAWDGRSWEDLTREDPVGTSAYWADYVDARPPGGESYREVYTRASRWWADVDPEGTVVIVTHIGVLRALMCAWMGLEPGQALRWAPDYASHSEVLLAEAGAVITRFGEEVAGSPAASPAPGAS